MKKRIKINGFLLFLITILLIFSYSFSFSHLRNSTEDVILDSIGLTLILFGEILRISARGYKSEYSQGGKKLITQGPYSLVRHPMYLGSFLIGLGFILMIFQWWVILLFITIFYLRFHYQITMEENLLKIHFKEKYKVYQKVTPCFFPRVNNLLKLDIRQILPMKWPWFRKEKIVIIVWLCLAFILETWEDVSTFTLVEYLREILFFIIIGFCFLGLVLTLRVEN